MDEKLRIFYELYDRRRSVRKFKDREVERDVLDRLLETLRRAQSAANCQPWHFVVVEKEDRHELNAVFTKEGFKGAPVVIVALADPAKAWKRRQDGVNFAWVDVSIALTEMIGSATAEGLGACWIASLDPVEVKRILKIPAVLDVVAIIALGYPEEELKRVEKDRKPLEEIIHWRKW
jgi:nitroreductase